MRRRLLAILALVVGAATVVLAVVVAFAEFPRGLGVLGCVLIAGASAWYGVLRRGVARVAGWLAHWMEQLIGNRIFRPEQISTGKNDVAYVPLEKRT